MASSRGPEAVDGRGGAARLVEALTLIAIAVPALERKLLRLGSYDCGPDGSLYMDVAQHLLAGDGLVTSVSLYHQGYPVLPHPTSVQPLWPLLLAAAARVTSLPLAATALPTFLWAITLALAFVWGRQVAPSVLPALRGVQLPTRMVHGGHVAFALLALAPDFSSYTSRPYTEGISFALIFACLLRAPRLFERRTVGAGVELGLWLALLFYARSQHLVIVLAAPCVFLWQLWREPARRAETLRFAVVAGVAFWLAFLPELLWVGRFAEGSALHAYLRFDQARVPSALSDVSGLRSGGGALALVRDRLQGVAIAFGKGGYRSVFGWIVWVMPLSLIALVVAPRRRWRDLCDLVDRHGLALVTAVGAALLMHLMHKDVGHEWWFGDRHALLSVLTFLFAYFLCVRAGGVFAWGALVLFLASTTLSSVDAWVTKAPHQFRPLNYRLEAQARLLALQARESGPMIVAMPRHEARYLAWLVPGVGFQGIMDQTTVADLEYMVDKLGVRYVVTMGTHVAPPMSDPRFEERFEEVDRFYSAPERPRKKKRKSHAPKGERPEDLVRVYAPRFAPGAERGPAD